MMPQTKRVRRRTTGEVRPRDHATVFSRRSTYMGFASCRADGWGLQKVITTGIIIF